MASAPSAPASPAKTTTEYTANADGLGTLRLLEAIRILGLEKTTRFYQASTSELARNVQPAAHGTALTVGRQHVQGWSVGHGGLAIAARHLDIDAPKTPLTGRCAQPAEGGGARTDHAGLVLGEVAQLGGANDVAGVRRLGAREQAQQGRLAGAVLPDDPDGDARDGGEVHAVQHHAVAVRLGEVTGDEGGDARPRVEGVSSHGTPVHEKWWPRWAQPRARAGGVRASW